MLGESTMLASFLTLEATMTRSKDKRFGEKAQASLLDDEEFLPKVLESYLQRFLERELAAFLSPVHEGRPIELHGYQFLFHSFLRPPAEKRSTHRR